jgi:hypothetical protein
MGDYQGNLSIALAVVSLTLFVMSWDFIPTTISKMRKVFNR